MSSLDVYVKGDALLELWLSEVSRLHGEKIAAKSKAYYHSGWYYIQVARRFGDGSVGTIGSTSAYRAVSIREMIINLRQRATPSAS